MRTFPAFFEKITAVFAVSEHYALEFMRFLQGQSIRVPEDVQIIGFDDTLASRESVPALTTIHQDAALRARTAIRRLEALRCRHRSAGGAGGTGKRKEAAMSDFMRTLCKIAIPVTLQGMLQASFSIVDQIMIGQLGEAGIAAVGLCSNFTLIFSVMSGAVGTVAGILIAQFLGAEEHTEAWRSLDVSLVCGGVLAALFLLTAGGFPAQVLGLYTADDAILRVGAGYFRIVAFSYLPMAVSTVLSAWLRCKEHAAVPFWASFGAVAANTGLNYLLIFGKLGAPAMGVTGAAIATLVSQLLNLLLILIGFAVCLQKEAERPLTVEIWTRWAGVLCLFSEYNGEPDFLFRLAQVKSAAIGDGHAQLIERTGGKFRYSLAVLVCDRPQCRIDLC